MYQAKDVPGQLVANRIRRNIAQIMQARGMSGTSGLPSISGMGLYRFISGKSDMTLTRVQRIADDLGVTVAELLSG